MSSILKALKKLENENAARNHDPVKIDTEILHGSAQEHVSSIKVILLAVFLFVCGGSATYIYMKQGREAPHASAKISGTLAPKTTLPSSSPVSPVQVERIEPEPIAAAAPESNIKQNRAAALKTTVTQVSPRPLSEPTRVQPAQSIKTVTGGNSATVLQIPALRVNGIAFQDGSDSVAVVNGVPVSKGSSIEGVNVDEIQRDRVLFSNGGEKISIHLGKSNR
jgi:general secretion pathway protein B